jgi:hypothetical protein
VEAGSNVLGGFPLERTRVAAEPPENAVTLQPPAFDPEFYRIRLVVP